MKKIRSSVGAFRVVPQITDQVADNAATLEEARGHAVDRRTKIAGLQEAKLIAENDRTGDTAERAKRSLELDAEIREAEKDAELADRDAKRARVALNEACIRALRSDESIRRRREIVANFREDDVARVADYLDGVRADLIEMLSERRFVGKSLAAELRTIPEATAHRGSLDAESSPVSLPAHVESALATILDALTEFPYKHSVRQAITGEGGLDKLTDYTWKASDFPADIARDIATGLDPRVAKGWLAGDFSCWQDQSR